MKQQLLRRPMLLGYIALLLVSILSYGGGLDGSNISEWVSYGHDPGGMRFSPLKQINRSNVARLQRAWTYHTGESESQQTSGGRTTAFECTPLVVDGVLYLSTPSGRV